MDVVILCGGKGTRLGEETLIRPKPMVEIGGMPILWHIIKIYKYYGFSRFVLALGYKSTIIKQYFYNYRITGSDFTLKLDPNSPIQFFNKSTERDIEIVFVDTGEETLKGGRIKRIESHIQTEQFHLTYGDGVSDVDIKKLVQFHKNQGKIGTVTAVHPPSRFGEMVIKGNDVLEFEEKPQMATGYINGGFFVFGKEIFNYLDDDEQCDFEFGPLQELVKDGNLSAYQHKGFWQPMDNIREKNYLDKLIRENNAPWIKWQ